MPLTASPSIPVTRVSPTEYERWLREYTLIEKDGAGVKVLRCDNGEYIKFFRIKHLISFSRIVNPTKRFSDNALHLKALGIDTITPVARYHLPELKRWAVRYAPLPGTTLRILLKEQQLSATLVDQLGNFIHALHDKGIYFRSLHLGNIVLQPNGNLGLIDVLDCRFRWFQRPLTDRQRARNFRHLFRYEDARSMEAMIRDSYKKAKTAFFKTESK